jgi:hypothetical protein
MAKKVERIENGNTYYVYPKDTPVIIDGLIVSITDVYLCPKGEVYYQLSNLQRLFKSSVLESCVLTLLT